MTDARSELPGINSNDPGTEERFDWNGPDVIIDEQPTTAVYRNTRNGIVIRQQMTGMDDEDQYVFFSTDDDVRTLIHALEREIAGA
ncbi:hypothetical protein HJA87_11960 [Rhizobium bangladeshense]|uniref:Uncharacterized protein n=1 Tax=Rhizobium bangladeshense TaxID=1138189 RepID=A0ABS7LH47_9HYPH|nr:hypothetical protein [Rhizobium bangladeshense]MBY3590593.1 hypothetical protein [Rhizobium bangladeshense]